MGSSTKKHKKESKKHKHKNKSRSKSRSPERIVRRVVVNDDTVQTLRHSRSENSSSYGSHHRSHKSTRKEQSSESDSDSSIIILSEKNSRSRSTEKEKERGRERDRERDKYKEREAERERDKYKEREAERERERERDRERERERDRETERERERERDRERERERERDYEKRRSHKKHKVKEHRHHHRHRDRSEIDEYRDKSKLVDDYESDSSDCVEVPLEAPPAPIITQSNGSEKRRRSETPPSAPSPPLVRSPPPPPKVSQKSRSSSPIPENGAGDCLSIQETNKLRAKLGLKPLEMSSGPLPKKKNQKSIEKGDEKDPNEEFSSYKDDWGEFVHKPANNLSEKAQTEKIREKIRATKERRTLEQKLKRIKTLGESDDEVDDVNNWLERSKKKEEQRNESKRRAKILDEVDNEFGISDIMKTDKQKRKNKAYKDKDLKGLRVDHDLDEFKEGKTVILTLKDKEVLNEDGDALVNVNMLDDEHYRKNVTNKKLNPLSYGYDVYEEEYDVWGNPIDKGVLSKYDEEIDKDARKKTFTIGDNVEEEIEHRRKLLEIKTKLTGKKLESLQDTALQLARDTYNETELTKFRKPKKKVKKLRPKLKVDDLLQIVDPQPSGRDFGSRRNRQHGLITDDTPKINEDLSKFRVEVDDEDDLARCLSKARKLKQQEALITKPLPIDPEVLKSEIKEETAEDDSMTGAKESGFITLNATAEFCRTLGDIPTYGMSGNRDEDSNDMMDFDLDRGNDDFKLAESSDAGLTGTWNSVNPNLNTRGMDLEDDDNSNDIKDIAILDEEPDVGSGVAAALRLALSKGYLEKEERNRPSNAKMAHLQAKNYTIDDKSYNEEEKGYNRRDRYHGPISDFKDKDNFKPNVKLDYIDDNGRILNAKEAFRYLSHKFHGKGPGKNKIEKRLKKMEQDGLMKTMSSTDTPLGTLTMLQQKQKETQQPFVVLSGGKQIHQHITPTSISKHK